MFLPVWVWGIAWALLPKGMTGPIGYVEVDDIHARLRSLLQAGARERQGVTDVGSGKLTAWLEDADGNLIGLQQTPA